MRSLNPTMPVLPIGVFRHFRAAASVHSVTSPNKLTVQSDVAKLKNTGLVEFSGHRIPVNLIKKNRDQAGFSTVVTGY